MDLTSASFSPDDRQHHLHPERFDPESMSGGLMEAEHLVRYFWAARAVGGKDVLDAGCGTGYGVRHLSMSGAARVIGIDSSREAIDQAKESVPQYGEFLHGDICDLPFPDESFDVAVCFEVIEHVESPERAVRELHRILRSEGMLLLSTPNREMYADDNPHHLRQYDANELKGALEAVFAQVVLYRQYARVASEISHSEVLDGVLNAEAEATVHATVPPTPDREAYVLAAASDGDVPKLGRIVTLTDPFELKWWSEQLDRGTEERGRLHAELAEVRSALDRSTEERDRLHAELAEVKSALDEVLATRTWRYTAALRRAFAAVHRPSRGAE